MTFLDKIKDVNTVLCYINEINESGNLAMSNSYDYYIGVAVKAINGVSSECTIRPIAVGFYAYFLANVDDILAAAEVNAKENGEEGLELDTLSADKFDNHFARFIQVCFGELINLSYFARTNDDVQQVDFRSGKRGPLNDHVLSGIYTNFFYKNEITEDSLLNRMMFGITSTYEVFSMSTLLFNIIGENGVDEIFGGVEKFQYTHYVLNSNINAYSKNYHKQKENRKETVEEVDNNTTTKAEENVDNNTTTKAEENDVTKSSKKLIQDIIDSTNNTVASINKTAAESVKNINFNKEDTITRSRNKAKEVIEELRMLTGQSSKEMDSDSDVGSSTACDGSSSSWSVGEICLGIAAVAGAVIISKLAYDYCTRSDDVNDIDLWNGETAGFINSHW